MGFLRQLLFTSAQVVVSNCGQGSRTRSLYTLSETGSGQDNLVLSTELTM